MQCAMLPRILSSCSAMQYKRAGQNVTLPVHALCTYEQLTTLTLACSHCLDFEVTMCLQYRNRTYSGVQQNLYVAFVGHPSWLQ
jgi:hypothetical protein